MTYSTENSIFTTKRLLASYQEIELAIADSFSYLRKTTADNLGLLTTCLIDTQSFSTHQLATSLSRFTDNNFSSSCNRIVRFLGNQAWQVDTKMFKTLIQLVFQWLKKQTKEQICINIDFTSCEDRFLILSASVQFSGRALPIYFKVLQNHKSGFNQKELEKEFFSELASLLPVSDYILVLDRGFACSRNIETIQNLGLKYLIRTNSNWGIFLDSNKSNINTLEAGLHSVCLAHSKLETNVLIPQDKEKGWYLFTNLESEKELIATYKNRFQIEKTFQDQKSSGFNLEKTKITSLDRFTKLLFCTYLAQSILLVAGKLLNTEDDFREVKKKLLEDTKILKPLFPSLN